MKILMKTLTILSIFIKLVMCEYDKRILTALKYSKYHSMPTVVNGWPANRGQFPYFVSLKVPVYKLGKKRTIWENTCGGAIIGKESILSAAHCFELNRFYYARNPKVLRVVAGYMHNSVVHSGDTQTTDQYQWRSINKVVLHQNFSFPNNDIAVLFVDEPWQFTAYVNYGVPATETTDYGPSCYSIGFGRTYSDYGKIAPVLIYAAMNLLRRHKCNILWEMDMRSYICTDSAISDLGEGDSGAPLVCVGWKGEPAGRDSIVGVASAKSHDKTTLFTRVSHHLPWIRSQARNSDTNDSCRRYPGLLFAITFVNLIYNLSHLARYSFYTLIIQN